MCNHSKKRSSCHRISPISKFPRWRTAGSLGLVCARIYQEKHSPNRPCIHEFHEILQYSVTPEKVTLIIWMFFKPPITELWAKAQALWQVVKCCRWLDWRNGLARRKTRTSVFFAKGIFHFLMFIINIPHIFCEVQVVVMVNFHLYMVGSWPEKSHFDKCFIKYASNWENKHCQM